jgi:hypothetical protein
VVGFIPRLLHPPGTYQVQSRVGHRAGLYTSDKGNKINNIILNVMFQRDRVTTVVVQEE